MAGQRKEQKRLHKEIHQRTLVDSGQEWSNTEGVSGVHISTLGEQVFSDLDCKEGKMLAKQKSRNTKLGRFDSYLDRSPPHSAEAMPCGR